MIREIPNPFGYELCFFCGRDNDIGLKLQFYHDDETEETFTEYTPPQVFCGQGEIFHGGLQMGLLDEAMWWAGYAGTGIKEAVTVGASFRFLRPVYIGKPIKVVCSVDSCEGSSIKLTGKILNAQGKTCTTVSGEYRVITKKQYERMVAEANDLE